MLMREESLLYIYSYSKNIRLKLLQPVSP